MQYVVNFVKIELLIKERLPLVTKLILKTAGITLACIIGLLGLLYGAFALFCPRIIGDLYMNIGSDGLASHYYRMQYDKTKNVYDLGTFILSLPTDADNKVVKEYSCNLINDDGFDGYCDYLVGKAFASSQNAYEYFCTRASVASFTEGDLNLAIECADKFITKYGYIDANPLRILIGEFLSNFNVEQKTILINYLDSLTPTAQTQSLISNDRAVLVG